MKRLLAISGNEVQLLLTDPVPIVVLLGMPLVLLTFLSKAFVGGPAQSVPGLAALFGYFGLTTVGYAFFRDHGWSTWDRLRMSSARPLEVVAGKALPLVALFVAQQIALLLVGWAFFDMPWRGSLAAGGAIVLGVVAVEITLGLFVVTVCRTTNQLNAVSNLGALLLAGLGGALTPLSTLPSWVRTIAPVSPVYWALRGLRGVIAGGSGSGGVGKSLIVLGAMALGFGLLAVWRFRFGDTKAVYS